MYFCIIGDDKATEVKAAIEDKMIPCSIRSFATFVPNGKTPPTHFRKFVVLVESKDTATVCKAAVIAQRFKHKAVILDYSNSRVVNTTLNTLFEKTVDVYNDMKQFVPTLSAYTDKLSNVCLLPPFKPLRSKAVCSQCRRYSCLRLRRRN